MLATPHMLAGAAVGILSNNPTLAFFAGTGTHIVLDMVPSLRTHADSGAFEQDLRRKRTKMFAIIALDLIIGISILLILFWKVSWQTSFLAFLGALGGTIIDIVDLGLGAIFLKKLRNTFLGKKLHLFHEKIHLCRVGKEKWLLGTLTQVIVIVISIIVIQIKI